jgi:hypothetical protein
MPKTKSLDDRLFGAAVLKMSFRLRDAENSPAFTGIYPGVLRDLQLEDAAVDRYIEEHRSALFHVERFIPVRRGRAGKPTGAASCSTQREAGDPQLWKTWGKTPKRAHHPWLQGLG